MEPLLKDKIAHTASGLVERVEPDYGLLDQLLSLDVLTRSQYNEFRRHPISSDETIDRLLRNLQTEEQCQGFLSALESTDQQHVCNYIQQQGDIGTEFGDVRPLDPGTVRHINKNTPRLVELIESDDGLVGDLYAKKSITRQQKTSICAIHDPSEKNRKLLDIMMRRSVQHFKNFIKSLATNKQAHLVPLLVGTGVIANVDATLDETSVGDVDSSEQQIVSNFRAGLQDFSQDLQGQLLPFLEQIREKTLSLGADIDLIVLRKQNSVGCYFFCRTWKALTRLHELYLNGELCRILESIFRILLGVEVRIKRLVWPEHVYKKCQQYFHAPPVVCLSDEMVALRFSDKQFLRDEQTNHPANLSVNRKNLVDVGPGDLDVKFDNMDHGTRNEMKSPELDIDDPVKFYFRLDDDFRSLNVPTFQSLATGMAVSALPDKSWQAIADRLGFTAHQIDVLALEGGWQAPFRMLKDWGNRPSSKIRVIRKILVDVGREDLVQRLDELRKHGFDLYVCFKSETGGDNHIEVKVEGRKPLYLALIRTLEDMTKARTTFYRLVSERNSWHTECHEFRGLQIDITASARCGGTPPDGGNQIRINHRASLVDDRMLKVTPHGDGPNPGCIVAVASDDVSTPVAVENPDVDRRPLTNAASRNVCCAVSRPAAPPGGAGRQLPSLSSAEGDGLFDFREMDEWSQPKIDVRPVTAAAAAPTVVALTRMWPDADDVVRRSKTAAAGDAKDEVVIRDLRRTMGYHETVGNRSSLIKTAMRQRGRRNGEYIIRSFTDQATGQFKVALSVVYNGDLRHFLIHRRLAADGDTMVYYLFTGNFESSSLNELLDYYTHHPMAPETRNENDHALAPRLLVPIIATQC